MPSASRGSSAYKLQPEPPKAKVRKAKSEALQKKAKAAKKAKSLKRKLMFTIAAAFAIQLLLCYRWVMLYDLHNDINIKSAELLSVQRENEQKTLTIASMVDLARVEEFARNELGMRKIEPSQIVRIQPVHADSMQRVVKEKGKTPGRGIFGAITSSIGNAMEYLR